MSIQNVVGMKNGYYFRGNNLKLARTMRGLSSKELAGLLKISSQSLSSYENGKTIPMIETTTKISQVLDFPVQFFYSNQYDDEPEKKIGFFRKYSKVPKKDMERVEILSRMTWVYYKQLSSKVKFPIYKEPFKIRRTNFFVKISRDYIEEVANKLRENFDLGIGPLINLTGFVESLGIVVSFIDLEDAKIDAYTNVYDGVPVVLINTQRVSSSRLRFNLAHELAHILFHIEYMNDYQVGDEHTIIEEEANYFAGCFLMPEQGLANDLVATNLEYFISLKQHWRVSVAAIVTRAVQTGFISKTHELHLRQQISRNGWRKKEPLDDSIEIEKPILLQKSMELLSRNNSPIEKIAHDLSIPVSLAEVLSNTRIEETEESIHNLRVI